MTYTDALSRISQISAEVSGLQSAFNPAAQTAATTTAATSAATSAAGQQAATSFSTALATAISGTTPGLGATGLGATGLGATALGATGLGTTGLGATGLGAGALSALIGTGGATGLGASGLSTQSGVVGLGTGVGAGAGAGASLPASASTLLTSNQQQFASRLAADTGLDPGVVTAWLLAEESGGAASSRQAANNNDWLNVGYTDSATFGASDAVWSNPVTAADATAGWLRGQSTIPGYGAASSGVQSILQTAGMGPAAQIQALQGSGWASSGYPDLPSLYQQVVA